MKMDCPHCGVSGTVDDSLVGRKVRCPKCVNTFVVQAKGVAPIEVEAMDLEDYGTSEILTQEEATADMVDDMDISDLLSSEADQVEFPTENCIACGKSVHPALLMEIGSKKYCASCVPEQALFDEEEETDEDVNVESLLSDISEKEVEKASSPEGKKAKSGSLMNLLFLFLFIALACAAVIVFLDIKII